MLPVNQARTRLSSGSVIIGVFVSFPSPQLVELCGLAGADYVVIDAEHGPIDVLAAEEMVRAAEVRGVTPIVRVPSHDPGVILRYLDAGAHGIMAPRVNSAAAAKDVVAAVKYGPLGSRGLGPGRASGYGPAGRGGLPQGDYVRHANEQTLIIAQLEHIDAKAELAEILSTPGIDAFEIGTSDLSASMGFPGENEHPEVQAVAKEFADAVINSGGIIGDTVNDAETASALARQGYRMMNFSIGNFITAALEARISAVRSAATVTD